MNKTNNSIEKKEQYKYILKGRVVTPNKFGNKRCQYDFIKYMDLSIKPTSYGGVYI